MGGGGGGGGAKNINYYIVVASNNGTKDSTFSSVIGESGKHVVKAVSLKQ